MLKKDTELFITLILIVLTLCLGFGVTFFVLFEDFLEKSDGCTAYAQTLSGGISEDDIVYNVEIIKKKVQMPTAGENLVYSGEMQTYSLCDREDNPNRWYVVTGNTHTDVGNYTATVRLRNPETTVWDDGTQEGSVDDILIEYSILEKNGSTLPYVIAALCTAIALEVVLMAVTFIKSKRNNSANKKGKNGAKKFAAIVPLDGIAVSFTQKPTVEWTAVLIAGGVAIAIALIMFVTIFIVKHKRAKRAASVKIVKNKVNT